MRKVLLMLGLVAGTFAASAQNHQHEDFKFFKPKKGDVTAEAGLTGGILNSDFTLNNNAGMLRGRYFFSNHCALRVGFNLGVSNERDLAYGTNNVSGFTSTTATDFGLNVGLEKHFKGTARLSPYYGGDIILGVSNMHAKSEGNNNGVYSANYTALSTQSNWTIGIRGVIGADYYIAPRLYLGGELGFGLSKTWEGEVYNEVNGTATTTPSTGSTFDLGPSVVTGVRIGFVF